MSNGCPIFSTCLLSSHCKTKAFKTMCIPKTEVFKKGERVNNKEELSTFVIISGIGKVTLGLYYNEICDLFLLGKGQIFGELHPIVHNRIINDDRTSTEFWAMKDLSVCKFSTFGLQEYGRQNPNVYFNLFLASGYNYASSIQIRWLMNPYKVYDQVLRLLIVLNELNDRDSRTPLTLTHEEIALILRTDRTSVSLALEKLKSDGLVETGYRKINLKDTGVYKELHMELRAICPGPAYFDIL